MRPVTEEVNIANGEKGKNSWHRYLFGVLTGKKGFFFNEALSFDNEYDRYLYEVFSGKIQQEYEKRGKDECYMLGQIAERLGQIKR